MLKVKLLKSPILSMYSGSSHDVATPGTSYKFGTLSRALTVILMISVIKVLWSIESKLKDSIISS